MLAPRLLFSLAWPTHFFRSGSQVHPELPPSRSDHSDLLQEFADSKRYWAVSKSPNAGSQNLQSDGFLSARGTELQRGNERQRRQTT
jgi:hypothetical protein